MYVLKDITFCVLSFNTAPLKRQTVQIAKHVQTFGAESISLTVSDYIHLLFGFHRPYIAAHCFLYHSPINHSTFTSRGLLAFPSSIIFNFYYNCTSIYHTCSKYRKIPYTVRGIHYHFPPRRNNSQAFSTIYNGRNLSI